MARVEMPYLRHPADFSEPVRYAYGPDSSPQPGVPRGTISRHVWTTSRVFPGTKRRYWVYVPAQYVPSEPASLMVFQDGHAWLDPDGDMRAPIVFDNLIHRGEMPVTVGVFVDPGIFRDELPAKLGWDPKPENRSVEYDTLSDAYATFLLAEILPVVEESVAVTADPDRRAIAGMSSGGICAFTVAWHRPDRFRRVICYLGSFVDVRGGHRYPELIRRSEKKPLRVFLQAAARDLNSDKPESNWFSANLLVAAALADGGYDLRLVVGDGGHDANHGGAILPDALRWLWRDGDR
jgi:enterochelin esterase family protein